MYIYLHIHTHIPGDQKVTPNCKIFINYFLRIIFTRIEYERKVL